MRLNVEYWAIRWFWILCIVAYSAVMLGCSHHSPTGPEASTPQEEWVLSETTTFAEKLGKDIKGVLTDKQYDVPAGEAGCPANHDGACVASGWYYPGKAFYYRPHINTYSMSLLSDIAAHEVCHSISLGHDALHRNCILSLGRTPTYGGRGLTGVI